MAIVRCGYHKGVAMEYTTMAAAVAATSDGDTILLFHSSTLGRTQWALYYMTAARSFIGVYPYRGVLANSIGVRYNALIENLTICASTAYPAIMGDTAANTSQIRNCTLSSVYTAGAAYCSIANGDFTFVNCAALAGVYKGFGNAATSTLVMRNVNCTATGATTAGFGQGHVSNGSQYIYNCAAFLNTTLDFGNVVFTGGANCAYGESGSAAYFTNVPGARYLPMVTDNSMKSLYSDPRFGFHGAHNVAIDSPLVGNGVVVPEYTREYDINYVPWRGGMPSIGCSAGVDLNPKMRKGVFGRNRLAFRVGDYVHPDAPWIKYAGYIN